MKKTLIVFIIVGLFSSLGFSQLSFRFYGGMTHVLSNDIGSAVEANNELLDLYDPGHTGYFEKLCCGINFGGELFYQISKNIGVGIGLELIRLKNESNLSYDLGIPVVQTTTYGINAFPLMINFHYSLPITPLLNAYAAVGAGYYLMNIDYRVDYLLDFGVFGEGDQVYTFQSNQGTLGLQTRWGIEVAVSKNISFLIEGTGRFAKLSDIKGDWTNRGYIPGEGNFEESGSNHYFWYYEESIMGKNYPQVDFSEKAPSGVVSARKGEINLSGISFTVGIKSGLDFKNK